MIIPNNAKIEIINSGININGLKQFGYVDLQLNIEKAKNLSK